MAKLNINQRTIFELLSDRASYFLIPDYQRPYAWGEVECSTLWDDIYSFAIPNNDPDTFDKSDEYFLGPIVVFKNDRGKLEVIDGQQRLTTLILLLRAFYHAFGNNMRDGISMSVKSRIGECIWETNMYQPDKNSRKIDSKVATYKDQNDFISILKEGTASEKSESRYAENYRFFQERINDFKNESPNYFLHLPVRIMENCILLPIRSDSQDTALRIFSTMNNRGKSLSDSDIFKAQLYKAFSNDDKNFIDRWKRLENICLRIFGHDNDNPTDEIFTRYMYFERAKLGISDSRVEGVRKFYEADNYRLLREEHEQTFSNIIALAEFWNDVANQNRTRFSDRILRRFFVLKYAPNSMWTYITSVYFIHNRNSEGLLDDEKFYTFLTKIMAFTLMYAVMGNSVVQFRRPIFSEMVNIIHGTDVTFANFAPSSTGLNNALKEYIFSNSKKITKAMLVWYAFNDDEQELIRPLETEFQIEHIYAKNRTPFIPNVDDIGNKSILESNLNISASNYRFQDKAKYYLGLMPKQPATQIYELQVLARTKQDFTKQDIEERTEKIIDSFMAFVRENNLLR